MKELIFVLTVARWIVVAVLVVHGLIHFLGVAKGFGWAEVPALKAPIGARGGVLWLLAATLVLATAVLIAVRAPTWWWMVAVCAATVSQVAIATSWSDAKVGTVVNVILVLAAGYGFVSVGPTSFHAQWRDQATQALADVDPAPAVVTEADLAELPDPLAAYVRRSGAVGKPRVVSFYADVHGRIRSGPDSAWMPFTGKQLNSYGPRPQRVFIMDASRSGLPVTVLHLFGDSTATMRVRLLSLVPVVDAAGPEMDRGETVTVFNDLVVLAPGAIPDAPVQWSAVDARHVRGVFTDGDQTVSAELTFNAEHDLVDFVSEDRLRASTDGKTFTPQRWSTPLSEHREADGRRVMTVGEGRWQAPAPGGRFAYIEFHLDAITYNVRNAEGSSR
ncbi:MAG: hypothetical protein JWN06_1643 [Propionibacteriaceae bacterium]|nr:hypothetical protein [Propionibacteriaceae bacterium]